MNNRANNVKIRRRGKALWVHFIFKEPKVMTVGTVEVRLEEMLQKFSCPDEEAAKLLLREIKESEKNRTPLTIGGF